MTADFASTGLLTRLDPCGNGSSRRWRRSFIATNAATVSSVSTLYGTPEERQSLAAGAGELRVQAVAPDRSEHLQSQRGRRVVARRAVHDRGVGGVRGADGHAPDAQEETRQELGTVRAGRTGRLAPVDGGGDRRPGFAVVIGVGMAAMASAGATGTEAAVVGGQYASTRWRHRLAALTAQVATTARLTDLIAVAVVIGGYVVRVQVTHPDGMTDVGPISPDGPSKMDLFERTRGGCALLCVVFGRPSRLQRGRGHRDLGAADPPALTAVVDRVVGRRSDRAVAPWCVPRLVGTGSVCSRC